MSGYRIRMGKVLFAIMALQCGVWAAKSTLHAHQHGHAQVNVAVDGKTAIVELIVPAESIYGFEYEPATPGDSAKRDSGLALLKTRFNKMVVFDPKTGCALGSAKVKVKAENESGKIHRGIHGRHSEVQGEFEFFCRESPQGSKLGFCFIPYFPKVRDLKVQVLSGNNQGGADIDNDVGTVDL